MSNLNNLNRTSEQHSKHLNVTGLMMGECQHLVSRGLSECTPCLPPKSPKTCIWGMVKLALGVVNVSDWCDWLSVFL